MSIPKKTKTLGWVAGVILFLALIFSIALVPDQKWLNILLGILLLADIGVLIKANRDELRGKSVALGANSVIMAILVFGILGVLNFLAVQYPQKLDLTKNKIHTLSDQTRKIVTELKEPVTATFFSPAGEREKNRPLLENYRSLSPNFKLEMVDPFKEPTRVRSAGIKKEDTLILKVRDREQRVEDISEEKITNALIKLLKDKTQTFCAIQGHGEKNFNSAEQMGMEWAKKGLTSQAYQVKDVQLPQEAKVPADCDAIGIMGPASAYFAPEVKAINDYLENGGRAVIALDIDLKSGRESAPELLPVLETWRVKVLPMLVVDPLSRMLGVDAAVPIITTFSKESPITRDFQNNSFFPFMRPLEIIPGGEGLKADWIAQTSPKSWGVSDLNQLKTGKVQFTPGKDKQGPVNAAIQVEGKLPNSKAPRPTRLVVFGSSMFATNDSSRHGVNSDFFLNAISWAMEDESLISIRAKEGEAGKVELTEAQGRAIFLISVFVLPFLIAIGGIVLWVIRRRL